jgi:formylmethanofuran dehydrogenase subunit E
MLLPIELSIISKKKGYISPELAIGWRVGTYIREFFDGMRDILIATTQTNDAALALKLMTGNIPENGSITAASKKCQWDFLVYHPGTGTVLNIAPFRNLTELSPYLKSIENNLPYMDDDTISVYRGAVDELIVTILQFPIEILFQISEHRCRRIIIPENSFPYKKQCPRCGKIIQSKDIWDVDGIICCLPCTGLEPSWFVYH